MRICVICTGGTIGSLGKDGRISPDQTELRRLFRDMEACYGQACFDISEPYCVLSENLSARELNTLVGCVRREMKKGCEGIVITHGTDTIVYTAAALSVIFQNPRIPIVLVSSNAPLSALRANGGINFKAAIEWILHGGESGTFVAYANVGSEVSIHRGNRLLLQGEMRDDLISIESSECAVCSREKIKKTENGVPAERAEAYREQLLAHGLELTYASGKLRFCEHPGILMVHAAPGDSYDYAPGKYRAVLFYPYHSGTLPTGSKAFGKFCSEAREEKVPLYLADTCRAERYASTYLYEELGIVPLYDITFAELYIRLWLKFSQRVLS